MYYFFKLYKNYLMQSPMQRFMGNLIMTPEARWLYLMIKIVIKSPNQVFRKIQTMDGKWVIIEETTPYLTMQPQKIHNEVSKRWSRVFFGMYHVAVFDSFFLPIPLSSKKNVRKEFISYFRHVTRIRNLIFCVFSIDLVI